jgi:galactokinase
MVDIQELIEAFWGRYGTSPRVFSAPGRVNLIGEHTDYNDGFVLPMAIDKGTSVAIAARPDRTLRVWSLNLNESIELDLNERGLNRHGSWMDYVEGTAAAISDLGISLTGADITLKSDVSIGGGLSSSAALEIALASALVAVSGCSLDKLSLALAGQKAEHIHVGINCGIMDQFTSTFALKDHAILLDCRSLKSRNIPIRLDRCQFVICDSGVRHTLASSEYNRRRCDCELGVRLLSAVLPGIRSLRDVNLHDFELHQSVLSPEIKRRCRHVISENSRTLKAAEALAAGNESELGRLMLASHESLKRDYQVSCRELDLLVDIALAQPGVLGARMTGGGFGGCTVNLVDRCRVESFRENVANQYQGSVQIKPEIFAAESSNGVMEIIGRF